MLAGGYSDSNSGYYLYTGNGYWTMSPSYFGGSYADVRFVSSDGNANYSSNVNSSVGIRPTLNLKADSLKLGDGSAGNPYMVEG